MPLAILVAPFKDATLEEKALTQKAAAHLLKWGWVPIFLPWALERVLDDHDPAQRAVALEASDNFVRAIAESVTDSAMFCLPGRTTEGMRRDLVAWVSRCGDDIREIKWDERDAPWGLR